MHRPGATSTSRFGGRLAMKAEEFHAGAHAEAGNFQAALTGPLRATPERRARSTVRGPEPTQPRRRASHRRWDADTPVEMLLDAARRHDDDAWAELARRYDRLVRHVASLHGLTGPDSDDVSQSTWLRLLRSAGAIVHPQRLSSWLVSTAHRESLRILTGKVRRHEIVVGATIDERRQASAGPTGCDERLIDQERDRLVSEAVERLPPRMAATLRLLMDEDLSYAEIASQLGVARGTVGPIRNRALRALRGDHRIMAAAAG
jgi:RNA polymerase sigma factor (sigma-70 family)